jgi:WD40 repeat protein
MTVYSYEVTRLGCVKKEPEITRVFHHSSEITSLDVLSTFMKKQCVVTGSIDGNVTIYTTNNSNTRPISFKHSTETAAIVHCVAGSPSGKRVASAGSDKKIRIFENSNLPSPGITIKSHTAAVRAVCWSKDEKFLVSGSDDKTVKFFKFKDGGATFLSSFLGHTNWVRSVDIKNDMIISGGDDRSLKVWNIGSSNKSMYTFYDTHDSLINQVKFHPKDNQIIASATNKSVNLFDLREKHPLIQTYHAGDASVPSLVSGVSFHPSGFYLASSSKSDGTVKLWDLREGRMLWNLRTTESQTSNGGMNGIGINTLSFDKETGTQLIAAGEQGIVWRWNPNLIEEPIRKFSSTAPSTTIEAPAYISFPVSIPSSMNIPETQPVMVLNTPPAVINANVDHLQTVTSVEDAPAMNKILSYLDKIDAQLQHLNERVKFLEETHQQNKKHQQSY